MEKRADYTERSTNILFEKQRPITIALKPLPNFIRSILSWTLNLDNMMMKFMLILKHRSISLANTVPNMMIMIKMMMTTKTWGQKAISTEMHRTWAMIQKILMHGEKNARAANSQQQ
ncbi:hypothetical protein IEQ34_015262 [Dendrobium chrysotoxum]|uniref:Uncharacterized protein n=1 Tax=Dendrobium chrysotoxum TaxID=161865 RepID=A0AAV7GG79_DENCH|nr:hypothetical protein IEQ34_015262 [Dendrobium chrysotoxum]